MSNFAIPRFSQLEALLMLAAALFFAASGLRAETSLQEAFFACEASVEQGSDAPLRSVGSAIDEDNGTLRFRVETPEGTLVAMYLPPHRVVPACILWGGHPELEAEFDGLWQDWVEWEEAGPASQVWFEKSLNTSGSADLTDHSQPGFVVARCSSLENGIILTSQPSRANVARQILPTLEPEQEPSIFFQFSAMGALPGRCSAAVDRYQSKD